MNESSTYEKILKRKSSGKYAAIQASLILAYITVGMLLWIFCSLIGFFPAIVIFCVALLAYAIFFTQKFMHVEYEYSVVENIFIFSKIYGKSLRKTVFEIEIQKILSFSPYDESQLPQEPFSLISGISSPCADNVCFFVFKDSSDKTVVFLFENDDSIMKKIKRYNPRLIFRS